MSSSIVHRLLLVFFFIVFRFFRTNASANCKSFWFSNRPSQDCSSQNLLDPPTLLPNVLSLRLSNNTLSRIRHFPRDYRRLKMLRLDECKIERIDYEALAIFDQLGELDLSRNSLSRLIIPRNLGSTLRVLNLAFNSFTYVPDMSHLEQLHLVDLSHNSLVAVRPRMLPFNLQVVRLAANRFTHLSPWPFLHKLQELDVTFNDLECDCSLWHFVTWAEKLALFDSTMLPCRRPSELRKSPLDGSTVCGPTVSPSTPASSVVSLDDTHLMCCTALATPPPQLYWQFEDRNISSGLSQKHLSDSGRVEFCLEIRRITLKDLGRYRCVATLAGLNASAEFHVARDKIPIVLNSAEGIMIYCQFTICAFIGVCCLVSCCVLRSNGPKTGPKRDFLQQKMVEYTPTPSEFTSSSDVVVVNFDEKECDDWRDADTAAVRHYLQWRENTIFPPLRHETLCRFTAAAPERAPLARFEEPPFFEFDSSKL